MSVIAEPVSMSWQNIDVFTRTSNGSCRQKKVKTPVHILKNVNGQVKSGQLLAIMGASGAGKTTLMNVLTQRNLSTLEVKGCVRLNGKVANANNITALSAYVQQDDLFIGTLTVREHLMFQSRVRMDEYVPDQVRHTRVEQILQDLGLSKCADTVIGKPGAVVGISGGEKKRLAFASELLTNPSIMFCDEPTTGLDSFMALSVVEVLKDLTSSGRTVVCTIHQPSSEVFAIFDQLLLMADGRVAFMGQLDQALDHFSSLGLRCPNNYNPADFYIHNLAIIPGKETQCKQNIKEICDRFADSPYAVESVPTQTDFELELTAIKEPEIGIIYKTNWFIEFWALLWRSTLSVIREPMVTRIRITQNIFTAILLGLIYWRLEMNQLAVMNINGALFLLIIALNFQCAFGVINTFCLEIPLFLREHNNGLYRVSSYFVAKMFAEMPIFILIPSLFVAIFYYMVGLNSGLSHFAICIFISVLVANTSCSFGYFVSCLSPSTTVALALASPIMMPMLIFGGFFLNNKSVPIYFIWFKYISWFYYGNEALVINQWHNIYDIGCESDPIGQNRSTVESLNITNNQNHCIPNGKEVIKSLNFSEDNFFGDIIALFILFIGLRVLAFLALLLRSRKR